MKRIILCGCLGKMGHVIAQLVENRTDCEIVAGVDICSGSMQFPIYAKLDNVLEPADVIVDFSRPELLTDILGYIAAHPGVSAVLCTTGYSTEQVTALKTAAEKYPIFYSRNMSLGINLLVELSKKAVKVLGSDFDIEIIEKHHNQKVDAPSGTALMLADAISDARDMKSEYTFDRHAQRKKRESREIGLHAIRGGTIVGEHEVIFAGNHEVLTLSHSAQSKELFASGAVIAAVFMCGKPAGLYDMSDLI